MGWTPSLQDYRISYSIRQWFASCITTLWAFCWLAGSARLVHGEEWLRGEERRERRAARQPVPPRRAPVVRTRPLLALPLVRANARAHPKTGALDL